MSPATLTIEEMKQQYPNEWVLIAYTQVDENLNVLEGEVLAHSADVERLYSKILRIFSNR